MSQESSQPYGTRFYTPHEIRLTRNALAMLGALGYHVVGVYGSDITDTMGRLAAESRTLDTRSPIDSVLAFSNRLNEFSPVAAAVLAIEAAESLREAEQ